MSQQAPALGSANRDVIDNLMYPLYVRLARFIPASVRPNQLTVVNFICGIAAGACLLFVQARWGLLAAAAFLYLHTLFDALDGIHARLTGQQSRLGHFLDHFFDGFTYLLLFFAVLVHFSLLTPFFVFLLMLRLLLQSTAFLVERLTDELHLPEMGPTFEAFVYLLTFVAMFSYPDSFRITAVEPPLRTFLEQNSLLELNLIKCVLLIYCIALPLSILGFLQQAIRAVQK